MPIGTLLQHMRLYKVTPGHSYSLRAFLAGLKKDRLGTKTVVACRS